MYDKQRYNEILRHADSVHLVSKQYTTTCMQQRNQYMVNKSDVVIAVTNEQKYGGTYNTIEYAKSKQKEIVYIKMRELL